MRRPRLSVLQMGSDLGKLSIRFSRHSPFDGQLGQCAFGIEWTISRRRAAISDLTFDFARSLDLHVNPFVPLDRSTMRIAIAPPFPLRSLPDENILRVCSQLRPSSFDATTGEKESEMLATLHTRCTKFALQGPVRLPSPHADIDMIVTDDGSSTIILAEMKWIRKTLRPIELRLST